MRHLARLPYGFLTAPRRKPTRLHSRPSAVHNLPRTRFCHGTDVPMDSETLTPSIVSDILSDTPQAPEVEPDEEELDELNSDSDEDPGPGIERIPGESLLPSRGLENIIQADGVTGSLALSKEGLFILSVATEEFIKRLTQGGHRQASAERRVSVNYRDMAATTQQYQEFMFLRETIPTPVSLSDALKLRELKEKEMLDDDPALAAPTPYSSTVGHAPSTSKSKAKNRALNGKEKQRNGDPSQVRWDYEDTPPSNGHIPAAPSTSTSTRGGRESGWTRWPNGQSFIAVDPLSAPPQHNGDALAAPQQPKPSVNGQASAPPRPREPETAPARQHPNYWRSASPWSTGLLDTSASRQPGATSRDAAGLAAYDILELASGTKFPAATTTTPPVRVLDGPGGSLSRSGPGGASSLVSQNPGRTIYSQTKPQ
ncbi:hypothetical protein DFH06DRAFT_669636 [Mycena polygramma]|nr:hypothetical protein DFH06DRAFT_669636 [Mycena polygramma]